VLSSSVGLVLVYIGAGIVAFTLAFFKRYEKVRLADSKGFRARGSVSPSSSARAGLSEAPSKQVIPPKKQFGRLSLLERRLKYAQVSINPSQFRMTILAATAAIYISLLTIPRINTVIQLIIAVWGGSLLVNYYINRRARVQFEAFDRDFAPFIMAFVGLLKSGMNLMAGMEAASERLGPDSLLRKEVVRMLERLRFGVNEDFAIGSFAESVDHPDIELFVQAMLLSKQVGGSLSNTLERLARQARRRAQFRLQAQAAVGQQRGSVWAILAIVALVQTMLYFQMPDVILAGLRSDIGFIVWQVAFLIAWFAVWLIGRITKIKV
jgi:Flp pilus assembly protein TadB